MKRDLKGVVARTGRHHRGPRPRPHPAHLRFAPNDGSVALAGTGPVASPGLPSSPGPTPQLTAPAPPLRDDQDAWGGPVQGSRPADDLADSGLSSGAG